MVTLTHAEGNRAGDLDVTRRSIALALAGGYAVAAFSADADPIHTDETGLVTATVQIAGADRAFPAIWPVQQPETDTRSCSSTPRSSGFMNR